MPMTKGSHSLLASLSTSNIKSVQSLLSRQINASFRPTRSNAFLRGIFPMNTPSSNNNGLCDSWTLDHSTPTRESLFEFGSADSFLTTLQLLEARDLFPVNSIVFFGLHRINVVGACRVYDVYQIWEVFRFTAELPDKCSTTCVKRYAPTFKFARENKRFLLLARCLNSCDASRQLIFLTVCLSRNFANEKLYIYFGPLHKLTARFIASEPFLDASWTASSQTFEHISRSLTIE